MTNRIELTKLNLTATLQNMFGVNSTKTYFGNNSASPNHLLICKGAVPTDAEISALTGTSFFSLRANDVLIDFDYSSLADVVSGNIAKMKNSAYTAAKASGDATFFILYTNGGTVAAPAIDKAIVGTITDSTGSGDLKLPSVAIVSGKTYRMMPLSFAVPMQYSY